MNNYIYIIAGLPDFTPDWRQGDKSLEEYLCQVKELLSAKDQETVRLIEDGFDKEKIGQEFYKEALGLVEVRRKEAADGSFTLVFLGDAADSVHNLELTWLRDWDRPYNLGDNEFHLAFVVDDFEAAHAKHKEMGCICFENEKMGIYFINDPDNYWIEIIPAKR